MHRALLPPAAVVLVAAAAAQSPPSTARVIPYPIDLPQPFAAAIEAGTRTTGGSPGPAYWTDHAHYHLVAELDPQAARLTGTATLTYHNRSPRPLDQLVVHLYQDLMKAGAPRTRTVVATPGFELLAVRLRGEPIRPAVRDTRMFVRLGEALPPGEQVALEIDYAFDVPRAGTAPRMGHEQDRVFYLGYWYPQFAVHDDVHGWVADPHRGNGEFYMGYADYDVALTAPVGYVVQATGELQNADEVLTATVRERLVRAAATRDVVAVLTKDDLDAGAATASSPTGRLTWRFRAGRVRDVAVSVARTYLWDATSAVVKDRDGPGRDGTCLIHAVYEPGSGDWVRAAEYARHTIEFMSARLYPYPWPHMTCCEGIIGGGMEYPMMTIVGGRQPGGTIAHELIHMWFPMLVGSNEKRYAWQDEGFTTFWTTICRDDLLGRGNGPRRDVLDYAAVVRRGRDTSCMRHADAFGGDDFGFASYTKPAAVLHQLRALLGDETFFTAFRRYTADWAWKHPTPYDFFHTFSTVAGRDLSPYFRTWLFEAWTLDHAIAAVQATADGTTVVVEDRGRAVHPCIVEATLADGSKQRRTVPEHDWWQGKRAELKFPAGVTAVQLDPDLTSLDCDRDNNRWTAGG